MGTTDNSVQSTATVSSWCNLYVFYFALLMFFIIFHGLGISVGLHRLLSHRSFKTPKLVEYILVAAGYLCYMGSPIFWVANHRSHHKHVDTPLDPHTPRLGLFYSYVGWVYQKTYPSHIDPNLLCRELVNDPIYKFLDCNGNWWAGHAMNMAFVVGFRLLLWALFGWQVAVISVIAFFICHNGPLFTNVVCHINALGSRTYKTKDDSVNVWWLGFLFIGEGWHNNHHAFPGSARSGFRAHELDFSWFFIKCLRKVGLASHVRESIKSQSHFETLRDKLKTLDIAPKPEMILIPVTQNSMSNTSTAENRFREQQLSSGMN